MVGKSLTGLMSIIIVGLMAATAAQAGDDLRVKCETRDDPRSKVSIDVGNLPPGSYDILLTSGAMTNNDILDHTVVAPDDSIEVDYDSDPQDLDDVDGNPFVSIDALFIQGNNVSAEVFLAGTTTPAGDRNRANVTCRQK